MLRSAFFFGTGLPKLGHKAGRFSEVGTSVARALPDDVEGFLEAETSVAAASAVLKMFLGFLGIVIAPLCVKLEGV